MGIIDERESGLLADLDAEWREAIATLLSNVGASRRIVAQRRKKIEEGCSLQGLRRLLRDVVGGRSGN